MNTEQKKTEEIMIANVVIDEYAAPQLKEPSRPPSKGGNTAALHRHAFRIGENWYSFLAAGAKKWIFKGDRVEFRYYQITKHGESYNNVIPESIRTVDKNGAPVTRGGGFYTKKIRVSGNRLPVSRREARD